MDREIEQIIDEEGDYQIESDLYELRRKYMELKEERKKAAEDAQILENKLKLLQIDDQKSAKREEKQRQLQEERELIQSKLKQERDRLQNLKKVQDAELEQKKAQISVIKENIKNVVSNWKSNLTEKNKSESQKLKMIREENEKFISSLKQEEEEKNKQQCIIVKSSILNSSEKRKKLEAEKKLKMKQMLEAKIAEEMNIKSNLDDKIQNLEENENTIMEKRKTTKNSNITSSLKNGAKKAR